MDPDAVGQVSVYVYTPIEVSATFCVPFGGFDPLQAPDATQSFVVPLEYQPSVELSPPPRGGVGVQ
jgi:hypothetical protein